MAMVMMLILVPIFMLLAVSFVDPIIRSFRSTVNDQKTLLAKNVADSAFEMALWESRGTGVGENKKNKGYPNPITKKYDFGTAKIRWTVMATPEITDDKLINGKYTIPSPGSGTAGDDYCNTNEPVVDDESLETTLASLEINKNQLGSFYNAFSWPCNWNKLREGENITIPLYTENADGSVNNPFKTVGVNDFALKIRPACDPSKATSRDDEYENEICNDNERYVLGGDPGPEEVKTVVVLWEITGKLNDENGEDVYLTHKEKSDPFDPKTTLDVERINSRTPLTQNSTAQKPIDRDKDSIENFLATLYKPELKLFVIHMLKDNSNSVVPYLEYQFSSTYYANSTPVSNTSKVVHIEVMIDGGYSEVIDKIVGIAKSVSGFVIRQ